MQFLYTLSVKYSHYYIMRIMFYCRIRYIEQMKYDRMAIVCQMISHIFEKKIKNTQGQDIQRIKEKWKQT